MRLIWIWTVEAVAVALLCGLHFILPDEGWPAALALAAAGAMALTTRSVIALLSNSRQAAEDVDEMRNRIAARERQAAIYEEQIREADTAQAEQRKSLRDELSRLTIAREDHKARQREQKKREDEIRELMNELDREKANLETASQNAREEQQRAMKGPEPIRIEPGRSLLAQLPVPEVAGMTRLVVHFETDRLPTASSVAILFLSLQRDLNALAVEQGFDAPELHLLAYGTGSWWAGFGIPILSLGVSAAQLVNDLYDKYQSGHPRMTVQESCEMIEAGAISGGTVDSDGGGRWIVDRKGAKHWCDIQRRLSAPPPPRPSAKTPAAPRPSTKASSPSAPDGGIDGKPVKPGGKEHDSVDFTAHFAPHEFVGQILGDLAPLKISAPSFSEAPFTMIDMRPAEAVTSLSGWYRFVGRLRRNAKGEIDSATVTSSVPIPHPTARQLPPPVNDA